MKKRDIQNIENTGKDESPPLAFHPVPFTPNPAEAGLELRSEEFQEILGGVPHWILRWGIMVLAIIIIILLIGSAIIKYPDIISSQVVLTGSTPPAAVVARSSGKLKELFIADNQEVKSGEYLAVIENPAKTEDVLILKRFLDCFVVPLRNDGQAGTDTAGYLPDKNLQLGSLQSLYSQFYTTLFEYSEYRRLAYFPQKIKMTRERIEQYEAQYQNLLRQQKISNEQFSLAKMQFQRDSLLHQKGHISHEEYEKSQNVYLQGAMSRENMQSSVDNMRIQIAQLKESLLDTGQQDIEKSNGLQTQLQTQISQLKTEMESWEMNYILQAPIGGKITFTNYWVENQNIPAGGEIFSIVPESEATIIGKALLPVARSGKVKAGQKVNIRLENFPDNEFGILRDLPNMQGKADIITEDISLLERFFLPVKKILTESL